MSSDVPGTDHVDVHVLGHLVRLGFAAECSAELRRRVALAWQDAAYTGTEPVESFLTVPAGAPDAVVASLSMDVTQRALELSQGRLVMLHAAGLADDQGRTLAFVGPSGTGKTTMARALGRQLTYLSDETVGVEPDLRVRAFRKPLSVIEGGKHKTQYAPSELGLGLATTPVARLAGVVVLNRISGPSATATIRRIGLVESLGPVISQTSFLDRLEAPLARICELYQRTGGAMELTYSEAPQVLDQVEALLALPPLAEEWTRCMPAASGPAAVADAMTDGERVVLFSTARNVVVLDGVGPVIWQCLSAGGTLGDAARAALDRFGEPQEGSVEDAVLAMERTLRDAGVLAGASGR